MGGMQVGSRGECLKGGGGGGWNPLTNDEPHVSQAMLVLFYKPNKFMKWRIEICMEFLCSNLNMGPVYSRLQDSQCTKYFYCRTLGMEYR